MAVGIGAHQPRRGLGAIDRAGDDAEIEADRREVEAREMIELEPVGIGEQRAQVRRVIGRARAEAHEMLVALPSESWTTHSRSRGVISPIVSVSTAIDDAGGEHVLGQVFFVKMTRSSRPA